MFSGAPYTCAPYILLNEYTSNWPASRRTRPSTHYMSPSIILDDFQRFLHHGVSKATPGTTKMNACSCVFGGQATVWVFDHCNTGCDTFSCSFCGDFRCILTSFCKILDARLEAWSRCMNGPWSTSKCVIFSIFWSVFDPAKIELQPLLCGFPEK